jgi:parallel beta-helix repeat protein
MKLIEALIATLVIASIPAYSEDLAIGCGFVINYPGNYVLESDVTCPGTVGTAIRITVSNVTLKLNNHTLAANPTNPFSAAIVVGSLSGRQRLDHVAIIGPGVIRGGTNYGVAMSLADDSTVSQITIEGLTGGLQGIGIATYNCNRLTVSSNLIGSLLAGIALTATAQSTVYGNTLAGNRTGLMVFGGGQLDNGGTINGNIAIGNWTGIDLSDHGYIVFENKTTLNLYNGLQTYISLPGGAQNKFYSNTSLGNGDADFSEDNIVIPCTNYWGDNTFKTRNSPCIK